MRRFLLTFGFLLWFASAALALPSYCTITGTVLGPDGSPCASCKVSFTTAGNQEVGGSSFPGGKVRSWTTESDGDLPAGVEIARTLIVKVQIDKGATVTVQIPDVSTTDISSLLLEPIDVPSSTDINSLSGTLSVVKGGTGAAPDGDDQVVVSTSTTGADWETLPDCDGITKALQYDTATNTFTCNSMLQATTVAAIDSPADEECLTYESSSSAYEWQSCGGGGGGGSGDVEDVGDCSGPACFNGTTGNALQFEGSTADGFETTLTATDPTADRTITLPNATGTVALERVFDARVYGAVCDAPANSTCGSNGTDDTAAIQAAIDAAAVVRGAVVELPAGVCRFSTLDLDGIDGTTMRGQGSADSFTGTTLCTSTTNATVINVTKPRQFIRDLSITTGGTPTAGQILLNVNTSFASLHLAYVYMDNFYEAVRANRQNADMDHVTIVAQVDAEQAVYLGSVENRLTDTTITSTATMSNALVNIDAGLNRVDTIKFSGVTINMPTGKTGPALWIHRSTGTNALQWIEIANSTFESDPANTSPTILVDGGSGVLKDLKIANSYIFGGKNAVQINGGDGIGIVNSNIFGSGQDCVSHTANAPTWLVGTEVTDCSGSSAGTDSGVLLGASSQNFSMIGGRSENSSYVGNTQKYGIECTGGASAFSVQGVDMSNNGTAEQSGCSPPSDDPARWSAITFQDAASGRITSDVSVFVDIDADNSSSSSAAFCIRQDGSASCAADFIEDTGFSVWNNKRLLVAEATANGTDRIGIKAPASLAAGWDLTLPTTDGNASEFLMTDGSGVSSWSTVPSAGITDGTIVNADVNASAAIDVSKTALVAGAGVALSTNTLATASTEQDFLAQSASLSCAGTTPGKLIVDTTTQTLSYCPTGSTTTKYAALGDDNGRATFINALSCANGVWTDSGGTPACLTAASTPEYVSRIQTAGATVAAYAVVTNDGSNDDQVIEAATTVTQILGCSQSGSSVTSTNPVEVAMAGVARCSTDASVVAGSLVKLGATGQFALATKAEKTWGRALTDSTGASGTAYILLFDGAEGTIDHKINLWPSIADLSSGTDQTLVTFDSSTFDIAGLSTFSLLSSASTTTLTGTFSGGLTPSYFGLDFSPSTSTTGNAFSATNQYAVRMGGTNTQTAGILSVGGAVLHNRTYTTSLTGGALVMSNVYVLDDQPSFSQTSASGTQLMTGHISVYHHPTFFSNGSNPSGFTVSNDYSVQHGGGYNSSAGNTLTISNRGGLKYDPYLTAGSGTIVVTDDTAVTCGALTGATTSSCIKSAITANSARYFLNDTGGAQSKFTGEITTYDNVAKATNENGTAFTVYSTSATAQGANIGSTNLIASATAGRYQICSMVTVTRAATSSSTMPSSTIGWTDNTDSNTKSLLVTPTNATNSTAAAESNCILADVKASTAITYSTTGFLSSGATSMQYKIYVTATRL